ncbi:TPA: hypothetical protein DEW47_03960 [Patescibacteria group bacterium]|nr:MAG: hypothetical protein UT71_C0003G0026 [Parcubacteria group bacterium GW2011_GWF2_40_10]KKR47984.1 MAG: hypothetical protein UT83_C0001G0027 [Parcubacteria group bacterium GW2011_GWA2_40_143]KKR60464.1 MAG: hypothetical protein UT97_C0001G0035 [Parcubacteria group bacterium GW2011_GWC2_40_31]KKR74778.1 MAG: hypothetical protein UU18_C0019G0002 [Parcubacteria group bacterium GW2011_GWB2_40_8]KKR77565.1 MAG: hypothetical protein UU20_C0004G0002 [Parcubacteria group bacterium GW2011_GWE2_40_
MASSKNKKETAIIRQNRNKIIYLSLGSVFGVLFIFSAVYFLRDDKSDNLSFMADKKEKPKVIDEDLVIPDTQKVTLTEGRFGGEGNVQTPLVPKNDGEKIIVTKAILTVKGSYDLAMPAAQEWSSDAKVAMVKSLGAVTLDGKSSQWQLVFSSVLKNGKGYEVIIQADQIVSKKEIDLSAVGVDLPINFRDSNEAIIGLQELPQYSDATISALTLYYNTDLKAWRYTLTTSRGVTSTKAQ